MYLKRQYDHSKDEMCSACKGSKVDARFDQLIESAPDELKEEIRDKFKCQKCSGRGVISFVSGIKVLRAKELQRLSQNFIDIGTVEGWLSIIRGNLIIHGEDGDVTYQIVRTPGGHYCCHCDEQIPDGGVAIDTPEGKTTRGLQHVKQSHPNQPSPDPTNPSGYRQENLYTCRLVGEGVTPTREESAEMDRQIRKGVIQKLGNRYRKSVKAVGLGALFILGLILDQLLSTVFATPGLVIAGNFIFNIALGRGVEFYNRVDTNDPANAVLVVLLLAASGVESDAVLKDKDDLAALVSGATNEATNTGYARKVLTDSDIAAFAPDDTNDRVDLDIPDQTWTGLANDGTGAISDVVVGFDPDSTGGADSAIVPISQHDFPITPDGSDVVAQIAAAGFLRAA